MCRTNTLQYPPAVPTVPNFNSTHSTHSTQYFAVPTGTAVVPNCHYNPLQYPQYPAVPTGTVQYPRVLCSTQTHPQYPQYPQYPTVPIRSTHSTGLPQYPRVLCSTRQGNHSRTRHRTVITPLEHTAIGNADLRVPEIYDEAMPNPCLHPVFPSGPLNLNPDGSTITYKKSHVGPNVTNWEQADAEKWSIYSRPSH